MADSFAELGFAKLDLSRKDRTGMPETIYCAGKTKEQLAKILKTFAEQKIAVLGTRCSQEQADFVKTEGLAIEYDECSKTLVLKSGTMAQLKGRIAVCTGGTADLPVAEEAARTAEFFGAKVDRFYDVGVAGIHRLFDKLEDIKKANVIIAAAGMEGALGGIITGMVNVPVIAVPTSVGYGSSMKGLSALLTMLNSCSEGMTVVNIDNGFNAGYSASQINKLIAKGK